MMSSRILPSLLILLSLTSCAYFQKEAVQKPAAPAPQPVVQGATYTLASFGELPGWKDDLQVEALDAFLQSCVIIDKKTPGQPLGPDPRWGNAADWQGVCAEARKAALPGSDARAFFETHFTPVSVTAADSLFTGYYEASLEGSLTRHGPFQTPVYGRPDDLVTSDLGAFLPELKGKTIRGRVEGTKFVPYADRAGIEAKAPPAKIIAYVRDPVDVFFLHIQGSGRIALDNGSVMRVGYAEQNGHSYVPIGRVLKERGELTEVTMDTIRAWLAKNPDRAQVIMNENPSFIFFAESGNGDGPKGASGASVKPMRSLAIDKSLYAYGTPFYIATEQPPLQRLMIAQDTGGAIKGPVRADVFWGYGAEAAAQAGPMQSKGRWWMLLPNAIAGQLR